jgi:NADH-quinone oxidoreductase subunit N
MPLLNLSLAAPEIFLTLAICVVLLVDVFLRDEQRQITYVLAMLALIGTAVVTALYAVTDPAITFSGRYVADPAGGVL